MFCSSHFSFLDFGHFWQRSCYKNTNILCNLCLHFCKARWARLIKKQKENRATKMTKIPKTKRQKYGMNKMTWQFSYLSPYLLRKFAKIGLNLDDSRWLLLRKGWWICHFSKQIISWAEILNFFSLNGSNHVK